MLVILLQISSRCKILAGLIAMSVLGVLSECCLYAFKFPLYVCMHLIYVGIVYSVFRVLDGRIRPIERELRALGA